MVFDDVVTILLTSITSFEHGNLLWDFLISFFGNKDPVQEVSYVK